MTFTFTRTHVYVTFANPFLVCRGCGELVAQWHDPQRCGCDKESFNNMPCGHQADMYSLCPTWDPVDGCTCVDKANHDAIQSGQWTKR